MHDRNSQRYPGEDEAADLLNWLNALRPSEKRRLAICNVEEILTLWQGLASRRRGQKEEGDAGRATRLNLALNRYEFVPVSKYDPALGRWISFQRPTHDLSRDWVRGEADAIAQILELVKMRVVGQVRKCNCGQYYFARFPKRQRFCSEECRVSFWENSEARKKQKRQRAKDYSHVPVLNLHLVDGILYPWRCRATIWEEIIVAESDIRTRQWRTSSPTNSDRVNSQPHLAVAGALSNSRQRLPTYASLSHHKMFGSPAHR